MPGVPVSRRRGPSYAGAGATFTKLPLVLDPKDLAGVDVAIVGAQALVELGLASTEPILVGGEPVRPGTCWPRWPGGFPRLPGRAIRSACRWCSRVFERDGRHE